MSGTNIVGKLIAFLVFIGIIAGFIFLGIWIYNKYFSTFKLDDCKTNDDCKNNTSKTKCSQYISKCVDDEMIYCDQEKKLCLTSLSFGTQINVDNIKSPVNWNPFGKKAKSLFLKGSSNCDEYHLIITPTVQNIKPEYKYLNCETEYTITVYENSSNNTDNTNQNSSKLQGVRLLKSKEAYDNNPDIYLRTGDAVFIEGFNAGWPAGVLAWDKKDDPVSILPSVPNTFPSSEAGKFPQAAFTIKKVF